MKRLACKDINAGAECNFTAVGINHLSVARKMLDHAAENHEEYVESMGISGTDPLDFFSARAYS